MKKILVISFMVFCVGNLNAQSEPQSVKTGDILVINEPVDKNFKYINLPRANFIIKKGGIADFKNIVGKRVKVTGVKKNELDETTVVLKRADGRKFFNSYPSITANLKKLLKPESFRIDKIFYGIKIENPGIYRHCIIDFFYAPKMSLQ